MTTQLTLITVPATPRLSADADAAGDAIVDRAPTVRLAAAPADPAGDAPAGARTHRRSAEHQGWLDRRTISSGRKGVAAARAALADANRRVAERQEQEDADRQARLASGAERIVRSGHAA